jgi:hypothetical protein
MLLFFSFQVVPGHVIMFSHQKSTSVISASVLEGTSLFDDSASLVEGTLV